MTHIAVFGSINMDLVACAARAPGRGETVTGREFRTTPGGKGANQAVAAARAGAAVSMIGAVGSDGFGTTLRAGLDRAGVDTARLRTAQGPSGTAHIVVDDDGGNSIVVVPGANGTLSALTPGDDALIGTAGTLLLQLEVPLAGVLAAAESAHRRGVRTVLTPAPAGPLPPELLAHTDLLVPNEHEAAVLTGIAEPYKSVRALLDLVPEVVITLGSAGCLWAARGGDSMMVPAPEVSAVDTTGAGDTFVGALAVAVGEGLAMPQALTRASSAAALSVQRAGAADSMPLRAEIDAHTASLAS